MVYHSVIVSSLFIKFSMRLMPPAPTSSTEATVSQLLCRWLHPLHFTWNCSSVCAVLSALSPPPLCAVAVEDDAAVAASSCSIPAFWSPSHQTLYSVVLLPVATPHKRKNGDGENKYHITSVVISILDFSSNHINSK